LSRAVTSPVAIRGVARPVLEALAEKTGESIMLGVPVGRASVQVIDEVEAPRVLTARGWLGQVVTTPASGFVRQLLAELPGAELDRVVRSLEFTRLTPHTITTSGELLKAIAKIKQQDYSIVVEEYELGLSGVGVPIRQQGALVAMIAVYMPTARFTKSTRSKLLTLLKDAAQQLED
jgi:DNA-binding IclR family transcriptional regulator